jgi:hypothetical protein
MEAKEYAILFVLDVLATVVGIFCISVLVVHSDWPGRTDRSLTRICPS